MNISVFGLGYVGCVSIGCLAKNKHNIIGVDVSKHKVELINNGKPTIIEKDIEGLIEDGVKKGLIQATTNPDEALADTSVSIICVGTPNLKHGELNLEFVYNVSKSIGKSLKLKNDFHTILIRSTVKPGTCKVVEELIEEESGKKHGENFAVVSNPEFLREGSAVEDYFNPPYTLIGSSNTKAINIVSKIYSKINAEIKIAKRESAELIKYVNNTFHALKVAFGNEVGVICKAFNVDSKELMDLFLEDRQLNISEKYLRPGFAYGGSCLPKDLKALNALSNEKHLNTPLINSIDLSNDEHINRAFDLVYEQSRNGSVGFLGISFKSGTDDLRNSPAVYLIEKLIGKGVQVEIYDNNVSYSILMGNNKSFVDLHLPHFKKMITEEIEKLLTKDIIVVTNKDLKYVDFLDGYEGKIIDLTGNLGLDRDTMTIV